MSGVGTVCDCGSGGDERCLIVVVMAVVVCVCGVCDGEWCLAMVDCGE